jgi:hypothetical protein
VASNGEEDSFGTRGHLPSASSACARECRSRWPSSVRVCSSMGPFYWEDRANDAGPTGQGQNTQACAHASGCMATTSGPRSASRSARGEGVTGLRTRVSAHTPFSFFPFLFLISFPSLFLSNSNFNLNLNSNYVAICLQIKCPLKHSMILFILKILFFSFLCIFKYRI